MVDCSEKIIYTSQMVLYEQFTQRDIFSGKKNEKFIPLPIPGSQPVHVTVQETAILEVPFIRIETQYIDICSENLIILYTAEGLESGNEFISKRLFKEKINEESIITNKGSKIVWRDQTFKAPQTSPGNFQIALQRVRNRLKR